MIIMKIYMQIAIATMVLCFVSVTLNAQQFELIKQGKVKKLDYNTNWYVVHSLGNEDECCNSRRLLGKIVEMSEDSMHLQVTQLQTRRYDSEKSYNSTVLFKAKTDFPVYTIAKSDIKEIDKKGSKFSEGLKITAGLLMITSVATAVQGLVLGSDHRKALLVSAGIQLGTSIIFAVLGNSLDKEYKISKDAWHF